MQALTTSAAREASKSGAYKTFNTHTATKRTVDLVVFAQLLAAKVRDIHDKARVVRIDAPKRREEVTVVLECVEWSHYQSITYNADGSWTSPSYWTEGQI